MVRGVASHIDVDLVSIDANSVATDDLRLPLWFGEVRGSDPTQPNPTGTEDLWLPVWFGDVCAIRTPELMCALGKCVHLLETCNQCLDRGCKSALGKCGICWRLICVACLARSKRGGLLVLPPVL